MGMEFGSVEEARAFLKEWKEKECLEEEFHAMEEYDHFHWYLGKQRNEIVSECDRLIWPMKGCEKRKMLRKEMLLWKKDEIAKHTDLSPLQSKKKGKKRKRKR